MGIHNGNKDCKVDVIIQRVIHYYHGSLHINVNIKILKKYIILHNTSHAVCY